MATFMKNAVLALTLPAIMASSLPAVAAVPMHAASVQMLAGYGDHDRDDEDGGGRWDHSRHDRGRHNGWNRGGTYDQRYDQGYYNQGYGGYNQRVAYNEPVYDNTRVWRGNDGRNYCAHRDGTTGLLIGGAAGALLGREVAGRYGDRTLGAILGAAGGALLGRQIDKGSARCR